MELFVSRKKTRIMDTIFVISLFLCCVFTGTLVTAAEEEPVCTVKGRVFTELKWYGYLVQKPFHRDWAKIQYQITYPVKECCTNLLIYYDDQIRQLKEEMTCKEREQILPANNNQIIPLYKNNRTIGCNIWNETGEPYYVCLGERIFRSSGPRTWYFALSRCDSPKPLNLNYVFNVSGFYGECEQDPLGTAVIPPVQPQDQYMYVSLGLGILAGIALIAAAVFFALWFMGRRRTKSKGSSVTSSQATMTQDDVFYVNPSLSDQGQTDYSQTSSENYYEVIPERRSYESINTNNLAAMQGNPHALAMAAAHHNRHLTSVKDYRPFHHQQMSLCVDGDYPPPPYQPPRMLHGLPKHHTLHHPPHHHGHHPHLHPQYAIHRDRAMLANMQNMQNMHNMAAAPSAPQTLSTHTETSA